MIGILTLNPKIYNYGGFLQEMALQDAIKKLGFDCEIINYDINQELNIFSMKRSLRFFSLSKIVDKLNKKNISTKSADVLKEIDIRKKAFDSYRTVLNLSEPYSYEMLHSENNKYTSIVCGSDQVWNPDYCVPSFFLDFANEKQNKISYAASIGKSSLNSIQKKVYGNMLDNLDYVSVREYSAKSVLENVTKKNIEVVLDPTLLHDKKYWEDKANTSNKKYTNYIFSYFLELNEDKINAVNKFADMNKLNIINIPYLHNESEEYSKKFGGILDSNVAPNDFLQLIHDADYVITDSFHAAVFSLIFEKDFFVFSRNVGKYNMNTRLDTLLSYFDANDRMILPSELNSNLNLSEINYNKVNNYKYTSFAFLEKSLK